MPALSSSLPRYSSDSKRRPFLFHGGSPSLSFLPHSADLPPPVPVFPACLLLDSKLRLRVRQGQSRPSVPSARPHRCCPRVQHLPSSLSAGALQVLRPRACRPLVRARAGQGAAGDPVITRRPGFGSLRQSQQLCTTPDLVPPTFSLAKLCQ